MICVDASVAAKWVFKEPFSDLADALLRDANASGMTIYAPPLLPYEVTNVIRQRVRRQGMPLEQADATLAEFLAISIEVSVPVDLHARALRITNHYDLPAAYDAHYVVLAETLGCDLWTDDQRLLHTLNNAFPFVRWIGDYPSDNAKP